MDDGAKKRSYNPRKKYFSEGKRPRAQYLDASSGVGFLCTCNSQEKSCVREAYNLLNEYADKLYNKADEADEGDEGDVSDMLDRQVADLKSAAGKRTMRFNSLATSVPNCVFIKGKVDDPVHLVHSIMRDVDETKTQKSRFLLRLIPIEVTCSIRLEDVTNTAAKLFDKHFAGEPTTFCIVFHKRYNNSPRDIVIKVLAELVAAKNPDHKVDLSNAKLAIIVEMVRGICLMSVVPDYFKLKKYNLIELCGLKEDAASNKNVEDSSNNDIAPSHDPGDAVETESEPINDEPKPD